MHNYHHFIITILLIIPIFHATSRNINHPSHEIEPVRVALEGLAKAIEWARARSFDIDPTLPGSSPFSDCVKLYEDSRQRLTSLSTLSNRDDAVTWLSAAVASHRTCLDGLEEKLGLDMVMGTNLFVSLEKALAFFGSKAIYNNGKVPKISKDSDLDMLTWSPSTSKTDIIVAKDGSGNYTTINEAVVALAIMCRNRSTTSRIVVHVKTGVYQEIVEIDRTMKNIMFVGDGMDFTIVTGSRNFEDGATTLNSATFGVTGDGFWARDMTFENTAGPEKGQAVALSVTSDFTVFYRCSFKGYQDTLFVHSLRQFYRDCSIYGTIDFIFGDAAAIFQNCDIFLRKPMDYQDNVITAQGRKNLIENTGISIINSRVKPTPELQPFQGRIKSYLGRPWKTYSRTVFMKTYIDDVIDPKGWTEWNGSFALTTLYFGEYMNTGNGAFTDERVQWPGYHTMKNDSEASYFDVSNFINGDSWIPATGVPFSSEI